MGDGDDQRLVQAARRGDERAFAQLVRVHYPALLRSCTRMLADGDVARDAAQEACLRAMLGLNRLRDDIRFGSWLIGIGLNVCRGVLEERRQRVSYDAMRESGQLAEAAADGTEAIDVVIVRDLRARVRGAIATLPVGQRHAVALFYIGGLTQAEAAVELDTQPGAIKTRLHKARTTLRASLQDTYREYVSMSDNQPQMVPMHVTGVRRTAPGETGIERHIVLLQGGQERRLLIWVGQAEATAMALVLEHVELPRPGVYQFAASLLAGAGAHLSEVRVTELTESTFYAQAVLSDGTCVDARPSDAITLALIHDAPILVHADVLDRTDQAGTGDSDLIKEANEAPDGTQVIASEALTAYAALLTSLDGSSI